MNILKKYQSEELQKIWLGYIETETHITWFPVGGGEPFVMEK